MANFIKAGIGAITAFLIARNLGPDDTGRMFFLLFSFTSFKNILDLGSSSAFFTFLSKEQQSSKFIQTFFFWVFIQFVFPLLFISLIMPDYYLNLIWVNEDRNLIILAFIGSFMLNSVWNITSQMGEAARKTLHVQSIGVLFTILHLLIIITLIHFNNLGLQLILLAISIEWLFAGLFAYKLYKPCKPTPKENYLSILQMYVRFCLPLVPLIILGVVYDFADKWMLQSWSGSKEQAYFGIAMKVSSIALLATTSILKVFWKESAVLAKQNKYSELYIIYYRCSSFLLLVSILFVAVVHPFTKEIVLFSLGQNYLNGVASLAVLLFYPIHQTLGQLLGSLMYATEKTFAYSLISSAFMLLSIFTTYFVLAPKTFLIPGLNLGSFGLSAKVVILNILSVNVLYIYLSRLFKWPISFKNQTLPLLLIPLFYFLKYFFGIFTNNIIIILSLYLLTIICIFLFILFLFKDKFLQFYNEL